MKTYKYKELYQEHYDLEIEEGLSSGLKRFATIDVSRLNFITRWIFWNKLKKVFSDFGMCRYILLSDSEVKSVRYFTITGECHMFYVEDTESMVRGEVKQIKPNNALLVNYVEVPEPERITYEEKNYEPMTAHEYHDKNKIREI